MKRLTAAAFLIVLFAPLTNAQLLEAGPVTFSGGHLVNFVPTFQYEQLPMLINAAVPLPPSTATPGYTLIGTVPAGTTTFVDTTNCKPSSTCNYEVTAYNSVGESQPDGPVSLTWLATSSKSTLTWTPGVGGGAPTGYNVYFLASPAVPSGLSGTVN